MVRTFYKFYSLFSFQIFCFTYTQNFVITGRGDEKIWFHCGIGIHEWLPSDNAFQEHALWSPFCVYVRYNKGPTFVRESKRLGSSQNQIWQDVLLCNMM